LHMARMTPDDNLLLCLLSQLTDDVWTRQHVSLYRI